MRPATHPTEEDESNENDLQACAGYVVVGAAADGGGAAVGVAHRHCCGGVHRLVRGRHRV